MLFKDRYEAAHLLAPQLTSYKNTNSIVLAIPRGGVPVGKAIAKSLNLPLDIILSKKIGHPMNREYAVGWVTLNDVYFGEHGDVPDNYFREESQRIKNQLREKYDLFRKGKPDINVQGRIVILVDDGIATGNTMLACITSLRNQHASKIIVAVPVAPPDTASRFRKLADEFICLYEPGDFHGVGQFYSEFSQVSDEEVIKLLNE